MLILGLDRIYKQHHPESHEAALQAVYEAGYKAGQLAPAGVFTSNRKPRELTDAQDEGE